jgi:hypothetical protein
MRAAFILALALVVFIVVPVAMAGGGCAGSGAACASPCSAPCTAPTTAGHEPILVPGLGTPTTASPRLSCVPLKPLDAPPKSLVS